MYALIINEIEMSRHETLEGAREELRRLIPDFSFPRSEGTFQSYYPSPSAKGNAKVDIRTVR